MPARPLTILGALHWAFTAERASLDFLESQGDNARPGVSPLWTIIQRGHLGCSVDGGGYSLPHVDADIIASAVAHLPQHLGGRGMAVTIAESARAGSPPDWTTPPPQWVPKAWKGENQNGPQAATEVYEYLTHTYRGRKVDVPVLVCPIRRTVSPDRIIAVRARYSGWRAALAWLLQDLGRRSTLTEVRLLPGLPVANPWAVAAACNKAA